MPDRARKVVVSTPAPRTPGHTARTPYRAATTATSQKMDFLTKALKLCMRTALLTSRVTSMQNLDVILYVYVIVSDTRYHAPYRYVIHIRSHPCRNGWTLQHFHIWSHIHAECGSDGCHICKIHVKYSARAARILAMHVIKSHLRKICRRKSHPGSHPCRILR